jgi:hypothetical protein
MTTLATRVRHTPEPAEVAAPGWKKAMSVIPDMAFLLVDSL